MLHMSTKGYENPKHNTVYPPVNLPFKMKANYEMRNHSAISANSAITAQSAQTAQSHLGNNKTLAQLKVCIVMSIHNMEKVVVLIANFPKYFNNCTDCAFHKFALIALFALIAHFITFS